MELNVRDLNGRRFIEGLPGQSLVKCIEDTVMLIEMCWTHDVDRVLLYPQNLPQDFFDLSSREAGEVLQKLRNYHIRLAVVCSPNTRLSSRFGEMLEDERRGPYFQLFGERSAAEEWLCSD